MNLEEYKNKIKHIYRNFDIYIKILDELSENDLIILYLIDKKQISIKISKIKNEGTIYSKKITYNKKYFDSILYVYPNLIEEEEKKILKSGKDVYINIFESDNYNKIRNRSLITSFMHKNTIDYLKRMRVIDNIFIEKFESFFKLMEKLYKFNNSVLHGTMLDGSFNLKVHNVRRSKDYDLVIVHPYYYSNKVKKQLIKYFLKNKKIDAYFHGIKEWHGETKETLDKDTSEISNNKINDYFELIFNPKNHYYFYGIKIVDFFYDLNYRALRAYPKNVADLLLVKDRLDIEVPKVKKIKDNTILDNNVYTMDSFLKTSYNYYKKTSKKYNSYENYYNSVIKIFYN